MKISLSILSVDYYNCAKQLNEIKDKIEYIHMDVMDGNFVPNISFGPSFIKSLRPHFNIPFDTHLMISNPIDYIEQFAKAGSDYITFHLEANSDIELTIKKIKSYDVKVGLSIKPQTEVENLYPYLKDIDLILIMSVEPGFGGQKFMPNAIDKIRRLIEYRENHNLNFMVSVDGGINEQTAIYVKNAGVDFVVIGSYILNDKNPIEKINLIENI